MQRLLLGSLAICLASCASAPSQPQRGPAPQLFISPFGEPFPGAPGGPYPSAAWFQRADTDQSGQLTLREFSDDGLRYFASLDLDADGVVGASEIAAYEAMLTPLSRRGPGAGLGAGPREGGRRGGGGGRSPMKMNAAASQQQPGRGGGRGGRGGQGGPGRAQGGGRPAGYGPIADAGFFNLPQPVKAADVNVDQRVTTEEWAAATSRWFVLLDNDRDGVLTLATLPTTPSQRRAQPR